MCGIVGYVGEQQSAPILVSGLKKLEYRGYDSAGLAVVNGGTLNVVRATGKLKNLEARIGTEPPVGTLGIGHTRWATHGRPTDENAHPHTYDGVAVVHNGIIENHLDLKSMLRARGHVFASETDTEVFAHLIAAELRNGLDLPEAVRGAVAQVKGTYGLAVVWAKDPDRIVATKDSSPMVIGLSEGQNFVASDVPALLEHTRDMVFLEEGDLAVLSRTRVDVFDRAGQAVNRATRRIDWTPMMAEKGGHKHFMHKEIWEQPRALADTLRGRVLLSEGDVFFEGWTLGPEDVKQLSRITLLACGTSWHSALVGRAMIESLARIPVEVEIASEFRYRDPLVDPGQLAIAISQSGETLDTLCALREAKARGARTVALCNVVGSAMTREADLTVLTNAGPEIGVASTKAFTTQLAALYLLAVKLGRLRGTLDVGRAQELLTAITEVPKRVEEALHCEAAVKQIARTYQNAQDFLFLGRGPMHPVALEGALKLKEISYIHAEGYAGGEMKHGPIALIDEKLPVVVLAPSKPQIPYEKMVGNVEEVRARGGKVIAVVDEDDTAVGSLA
ncbi:MAG: glutamine--fructose-6-phosphate transaminase (isomerizing), partial [Myxococcaceae bacterium]